MNRNGWASLAIWGRIEKKGALELMEDPRHLGWRLESDFDLTFRKILGSRRSKSSGKPAGSAPVTGRLAQTGNLS